MQYTTNYSLKKPQYADEADIEVINDNTDDVDTLIHQNRTMIAPAFDNTKAYVTGDPVEYLGALYVFTSDKAAGAWDASKVEPTTAAEMGGGGASALADLDDVEITSPTQGQALLFDDDVWKNQDLPDHPVTKEASGNPIEVSDSAAAPLVKCVSAITGSQDLHGYDKPWVGGAGKNKLPKGISGTSGTIEYTVNDDGSVLVTGTENSSTAFWGVQFSLPAGSYILSGCPTGGGNSSYLIDIRNAVGGGGIPGIAGDIGSGSSFTLSEPLTAYVNIRIASGYSIPSGGILFKPMLRLATVSDATFEPYSNICPITAYDTGKIEVSDGDGNVTTHTTTYPSAIYRGSEDVVNGEVTPTWGIADLSDFTWTKSSNNKYWLTTSSLSNVKAPSSGDIVANAIFEKYKTIASNAVTSESDIGAGIRPNGSLYISVIDNDTPSGLIAYELATPTTSSVTPTNQPIKSLSGYNHIESSTGEMEIEYITEGEQPIIDLIEKSSHIYSTQEQAVGTWIDGKKLYEQTLYLASASVSSGSSASMPSISGVETVMVMSGSCYDVNDQRYYPLPYIRFNDTESIKIQAHVANGSLSAIIFTAQSSAYSLKDIYVVVRYTKA